MNISFYDVLSSRSFHCLTSTPRHFLGKCLFPMFADVSDASRAVRPEYKSEDLSDKIRIYLTFPDVLAALGTGFESMTLDTGSYFTPSRFLVPVATGAFL